MYYKIKDGSEEVIQGIICQLPPVGYGKNRLTGELEYIGVFKRDKAKENQKWQRLELPKNYEKLRLKEEEIQIKRRNADPDDEWVDDDLEAIRSVHWRYRLCGHWFMNNGVPTYITGTHWFYLNWCSTNVNFMNYRDTDRRVFYVIAHTDENPNVGGTLYIGRRQCGKTYIAAAWMIDRISLAKKKHGGIQSKGGDDAEKVFNKLVNYFVDLPHFFKPVYDTSGGMRPKKSLRFFKPTVKGKNADKYLLGKELRSWIDYGPSDPHEYDGDESMFAYILDEFGKPQQYSTWDTWQVVRPCMDKEGKWFGKTFACSTIEDIDQTGIAPKQLWDNSDVDSLTKNNTTVSGLFRIFFGAHESTFFNDYGIADEEKAKEYYLNQRESLKKDSRSLSSFIRKNPFTIQEAFRIDGDKCLYDSELLNNQLDRISWSENVVTRGNLVWKNGERDTEVEFVKSKDGHWEICCLPEKSNLVSRIGNNFRPLNTEAFVAGADTFSHKIVKDYRRSDGALIVKMKFNANSDSPYNNSFVCKYRYRAPSPEIQYEDMLKTAVFYGCQILFESNKNNWRDYFVFRGYEPFLMKLKGYPDYGIPGNEKTHQQLAEATEDYILNYSDKVWFKDCLTDWLEFDLNNTTAFDIAMAAGYTLIADKKLFYGHKTINLRPLSDYGFKKHKIA